MDADGETHDRRRNPRRVVQDPTSISGFPYLWNNKYTITTTVSNIVQSSAPVMLTMVESERSFGDDDEVALAKRVR